VTAVGHETPAQVAALADLIYVTLSTFAEHDRAPLDRLERSGVPFRIHGTGKRITRAELVAAAADATALIAGVEPYDEKTLDALPALRCISRCGVGVDSIDLQAAKARGVAVVNTPDAPTNAVAELALAMMLALSRQLCRQMTEFRAGRWTRFQTHMLEARTIGVVGLGRIGKRVVELLRPFGCRVLAADPRADLSWVRQHDVVLVPLNELLSGADIVTVHATPEADAPVLIGPAEIARMRRGSLLINLARGGMVDERALYEALRSEHLAGAGMDVFAQEPYSGPLAELDNVVLTPHSATLAVEARSAMERQAVENALAVLAGREP
jgi:D-3-phosphoglycerate dehydrogenase